MRLFAFFVLSTLVWGLLVITSPTTAAQQTSNIGIAPLRQEGIIDPGFVYTGTLLIKNSGTRSQRVELSAETFNVTNQSYDYIFEANTDETKWVSFEPSFLTLAPGESSIVAYEVSVPIGTEPAGYYLALFALNEPTESDAGGITSTERVASLLYLTVSGEATRSGKLIQLRSPVIFFGQSDWSATVQNSGTLHYRSTHSAKISSIWGTPVAFYEASSLILPGSVRLIEDPLPLPEILGIYKIDYTVSLGDNPAYTESRWIIYLPPLQLILILSIIGGVILIVRKQKKS